MSGVAAPIAATWSSATAGTLNGVSVTVTGGGGTNSCDFSSADYSAAVLSASEACLDRDATTPISFTFSSPVSNLSVYLYYWLGSGGSTCTGTGTYTFSATPTVASGLAGSSLSGNDLSLFGNFQSGIVTFAGPLSSLTVSAGCTAVTSNTNVTLSVPAAIVLPPVSAAIGLKINNRVETFATEIELK